MSGPRPGHAGPSPRSPGRMLTSDHSDISHCGPQAGFRHVLRSSGLTASAASHRSLYTELSKPGDSIFQQRTMRNWKPSPQVREHSLQLLVSHLPREGTAFSAPAFLPPDAAAPHPQDYVPSPLLPMWPKSQGLSC